MEVVNEDELPLAFNFEDAEQQLDEQKTDLIALSERQSKILETMQENASTILLPELQEVMGNAETLRKVGF